MKRYIITAISILCIIAISLSLTGCESPEPHASAFMLGSHDNFFKINLGAKLTYDSIYKSVSTYGDCYIIVVDGNPYVPGSYSINEPDKMLDSTKLRALAKQSTNEIIKQASSANARTPEVDLLAAFNKACGLLNDSDAKTKDLYVCDSGLSTAGWLNFASTNLFDHDPDDIVAELERVHAIPEFNGLNVYWAGIGETTGDQTPLTSDYVYKLKLLWTAIIEAGGGNVDFINITFAGENTADLPYCSTVPVIQQELILERGTIAPISEEDVPFESNTAIFKDRSKAAEALSPIAETLISDRGRRILLAGSCASVGDAAGCERLSLQRAEACKELLCELGANSSQIVTVGLGRTVCSLRVDDLDENGNLIPEMASKNRVVFVMDADSDTARQLLK